MKALQKLIEAISEITLRIKTQYPELYRSLDENPVTLPISKDDKINLNALNEYLDSLNHLLNNYLKSQNQAIG